MAQHSVECAAAPSAGQNLCSPLRSAPKFCKFAHGTTTRTPLYAHQIVGVARMVIEAKRRGYFALLDECGLGKTVQCIYAALELLHGGIIKKVIIVCKPDLVRGWLEELQIHAPGKRVQCLYGRHARSSAGISALDMRKWSTTATFHVLNYELLAIKPQTRNYAAPNGFSGKRLRLNTDAGRMLNVLMHNKTAIILDESHKIKSPTARVTETLCTLSRFAAVRFIATGTLEAETPVDVWSQIHFLDGGNLLGKSYRAFCDKHTICAAKRLYINGRVIYANKIIGFKNLRVVHRAVQSISLRRKKSECIDLPEKIIKRRHLFAGKQQLGLLRDECARMIAALNAIDADEISINTPGTALAHGIQTLQRLAAMPETVYPTARESAKFQALLEITQETVEQIVVWCVHRNVAEAVTLRLQALKTKQASAVLVYGGMTQSKRDSNIQQFKRGDARILVCTGDALREGHNLQNAAHSVTFQPSWKRLTAVQGDDRIHRIGQTKAVVIETLLLDASLDAYILQRQATKDAAARYKAANVVIIKQEFVDYLKGL